MRKPTYEEFDGMYNHRNSNGAIEECSIITEDGNVVSSGTVEEMDNFWKSHCDFEDQIPTICGEKVLMTNLHKSVYENVKNYLNFYVFGK